VRVKVVDNRGRERPAGNEGEIAARGANIMAATGVIKRNQKVLRNGWLYTGDTGFKDKDGDLFITGRPEEFYKSGGSRVNPVEIERPSSRRTGSRRPY